MGMHFNGTRSAAGSAHGESVQEEADQMLTSARHILIQHVLELYLLSLQQRIECFLKYTGTGS
jgi:hypothetical protein